MPAPARRVRFLLLIVDPDDHIAEFSRALDEHEVDVVVCEDPAEALLQAGSLRPDAVLAAVDLHPVDSATLVRVLHQRSGIPVLLGVCNRDEEDSVALTAGATACVTRPYQQHEVIPILRAIRPDTATAMGPSLEVGALRLNPAALEVYLHGRPIRLRLREFRLLQLLMVNADRVVTREQIRAEVWKSSKADASDTMTVHIQRLRARLGDDPNKPSIILTVRGKGYRLVPPTQPPRRTAP